LLDLGTDGEHCQVRKDQLIFLLGGLAFGFLFGFGVYHTWYATPDLGGPAAAAAAPAPTGPPAVGQAVGQAMGQAMGQAGSSAPMVGEINQLKRMIQDDPRNVAAFVRLGNLHYDVQMWDQAVGYYRKALELQPDSPDVMTDLGICLRSLGQYEQALEMFEGASELNPDHHQSRFNVVIVAGFDLNQWDRADAALRELEAMNPRPPRTDELRSALERERAAAGG
jgi:cytochrome c-type biogenesis protein CcmH/NrfG